MLTNIADIDRLATDAIRVEHFATMELISARPDEPVSEVLAWMVANDFDVAPLVGDDQTGFILRSDLLRFPAREAIGQAVHKLESAVIVRPDTSFKEALEHLGKYGWFFVGVDGKPIGIITRYDLARPAVSLYLFARILALEAGFRRLYGTFTNTPIPDAPSVDGIGGEPGYLSSLVKLVRNNTELLSALGFTSKSAFDSATGFIVSLRNDLAHGRNILSLTDDPKIAVARIFDIDSLVERISALVKDREQIWKAFARTHVIRREVTEFFWVGPNAIQLPLAPPVHVISAANPFEQVLSDVQNDQRTDALCSLLKSRGLEFIKLIGQSPDGHWAQTMFAITGMSRGEACALASKFGQRAIFELDEQEFRVVCVDGTVRAEHARADYTNCT